MIRHRGANRVTTARPAARPEIPPPVGGGLLSELMTNTLDEDYRTVAAQGGRAAPPAVGANRLGALAAITAFGVLLSVSAVKTEQDRPQALVERAQLIDSIRARQQHLDGLHATLSTLQSQIGQLQTTVAEQSSTGTRQSGSLTTLGMLSGASPVSGPGVVVTVDDAPNGVPGTGGVILDADLQTLVNALWVAGAEAIAVNGHRLSTLTAIRFAGRAITVDYRSLTPPYVVEAIGNPATLPARLLETQGGQVWLELHANFGIRFETHTQDRLELPADPQSPLLWARQEVSQ